MIDLNNKDLEIFGVVNKSDVIGVNFFENPNVPQGIRDRVRNEDLVDFRLNYSFEQAGGLMNLYAKQKTDRMLAAAGQRPRRYLPFLRR